MNRTRFISILFLFTMLFSLFSSFEVYAQGDHQVVVIDNANLLTDQEEANLKNAAVSYSYNYNIDIVFLTTDNTNGKSTMEYTDDFYDGIEGGVKYSEDGFLLAIDMDNREIFVNTLGKVLNEVNDAEVENILDAGYRFITEGDYYKTFESMFDTTIISYQMQTQGSSDRIAYQHKSPFMIFLSIFNPLTAIFPFCFILAVIIFVSFSAAHKKNNVAASISNYGEGRKGYIVNSRDDNFVRSFTTVDKGYYRPKSSSSGGGGSRGGSSHRSSSGRSHGGGGRRF